MALRQAAKAGQWLLRSTGARSHVCDITKRGLVTVSLPDLPYDYGALQPVISAKIMELHHSKHHAAYVANFNKASEAAAQAEAKGDVASIITLQSAIKFNGGGAQQSGLSSLSRHQNHPSAQATSTTTCSGKTSCHPRYRRAPASPCHNSSMHDHHRTINHPLGSCSRLSSATLAPSISSLPSSTRLLQACRAQGGGGSALTRPLGGL